MTSSSAGTGRADADQEAGHVGRLGHGSAGHFAGHQSAGHDSAGHDSAGVTWSGRELSASGFESDTGVADPALLAAAAQVADDPTSAAEETLLSALAGSRVLVPVVAAGERVVLPAGRVADNVAEMATPTILGPDGRRALPVFTGVEALARWDRAARPVPMTPARAAQAAIAESCDVLLLDLGSDHAVVLRPSMLFALAMQRPWRPAHLDPHVLDAVARAVQGEPDVQRHTCEAGDHPGTGVMRIVLTLRQGLSHAEVEAVATRIGERLATDGELRARVDGLAFRVTTG